MKDVKKNKTPRGTRGPVTKFRCELGPLTLCVRERGPKQLDVRVVRRREACSLFEQALLIPPGTVLRLTAPGITRFVQARAFAPRMQYGGRCVAGGVVELI